MLTIKHEILTVGKLCDYQFHVPASYVHIIEGIFMLRSKNNLLITSIYKKTYTLRNDSWS